jgi:chromosome segregation ATPase
VDKIKYPLEQLALIKAKRLEDAEKKLQEKKSLLAQEEEKLQGLEKERDKVKGHKELKLQQLRDELDSESNTLKIQQMKQYLKEVNEKLKQKETKVKEQKRQVTLAEQAVESSRKEMLQKQQDVEKLKLHKVEWDKETKAYLEHLESLETDELGTTIHLKHKKQKESL